MFPHLSLCIFRSDKLSLSFFFCSFTTRLDEGGREDAIPGPPAARSGCSDAPRAAVPCHEAGLPSRGQRQSRAVVRDVTQNLSKAEEAGEHGEPAEE